MRGKGPFVILFTSTVINEISLCYIYISFFVRLKTKRALKKKANVIASLSLLDPACILLLMEILYHCWVVMLV